MAAPMQLVGRVLGHYRVLEPLGVGGMGVVYRARDERLDRDVALKVLPPGVPADEGARQRFRHEALALARLSHPNIATIHDFDHQEGIDFLVMEYVRGTTLADRLRNGALPEKQTLAIGEQIAKALKGAHEIGIVHRDLKPGNIMITPSGDVKLLDFGISLLLKAPSDAQTEPITSLKGAFGTLPYMSPEQLTGQVVDERCDIYTAGVVLHEMATGRRPFDSKLSTVLIADILHKPPALAQELSPQMSPALGAAILKCLEKDPDNRYQSAKELEVDLRRAGTASGPTAPVTWPVPSRRRRKLSISLIVLLAAISLLFGLTVNRWRTRVASGGTPARIRSLAVLPLQNLSNDASQEYFADGMTEELTTKLAQIAALRVISRTSAMQYKRSNKPLPEIARELRVDAVVEGSVMRAGDQVRITAQLIDAASDQYLWAADYEQPLKDVLRLQNQVAQAIVSQVKIKLTPEEQARLTNSPTVNSRALEAYLKGRFYLHQGTEERLRQSRQEFARAVAIDARYAAAYAGLADYYALTNELSPTVAMSKAKEYVLKALALDNNLAEAHSTLAMIRFYGDWDWPGAEEEFRRTIALNPSDAEAHRLYADFLSEMGRHKEALVEIHKAQELDPLSLITGVTAGWVFYYARQYDRALDQCRKMLDLDAQSVSAHDCLGSAYLAKGAYAQAKTEYQTMLNTSGNDPLRLVSLGRVYALEGRRSEAERVLGQIGMASQKGYVPPSFLAMIYASMGDRDQAFTWLERAYRERDSFLARLKVEPAFDPLRPDPRFASLLQRMKLSP
jgi:serine/threonine protein kinase/Tfp pilus assembly protein PilF